LTGPRIGILAYEPDQQMDLNHSDSGLGAFVYAGAWLSTRFDLEVLSFGRSGDAPPQSCKLELVGDFLAFEIVLDGGFIFISAQVCDRGDPPELLVSFPDGPEGWTDTCQLISALERNKIRSLQRPIEAGTGPGKFVIGD
jgi:hypothetical protein